MRKKFILSSVFIIIIEILLYVFWPQGLWSLIIFIPYLIIGCHDIIQKKPIKQDLTFNSLVESG